MLATIIQPGIASIDRYNFIRNEWQQIALLPQELLPAEPPAGAADPLAAAKAELSADVALLALRFAHPLPKVASRRKRYVRQCPCSR